MSILFARFLYLFCFLFFFAFVVSSSEIYTGTVVALVKDKIPAGADADYWGYLNFTAKWGQIIKPEIKDIDGKIIEKGTALTEMSEKYWLDNVNAARGGLLAAKNEMKVAYDNFKRYEELYPTGASSVKIYQNMRAQYYEAYGAYQTAEANLYEKERDLSECIHVAPFEGIVDKVFFSSGILAPNPDVIEISMLNPIGIKIFMDTDKASRISFDTPITIYFNDNENPIGIYNGLSFVTNDGIILVTRNYPKQNTNDNMIKVKDCFPVVNFYIGKLEGNKLGVPVSAVVKDDKGFYVWRAKDRKMLEPESGFTPVFNLEKVYITPGNLKRACYGCDEIRILKDSGKLELHDVVVISPSDNLTAGEKVNCPPARYVLMPGDKVKVVID